jgi:hypothetical protein
MALARRLAYAGLTPPSISKGRRSLLTLFRTPQQGEQKHASHTENNAKLLEDSLTIQACMQRFQ